MISLFCRMRLLMVDRIWRLREMCVSTWRMRSGGMDEMVGKRMQ